MFRSDADLLLYLYRIYVGPEVSRFRGSWCSTAVSKQFALASVAPTSSM